MNRRSPTKDEVRDRTAKAAATVLAAADHAVHTAKDDLAPVRNAATRARHQAAEAASTVVATARENTPQPVADTARHAADSARDRRVQMAFAAAVVAAVVLYRIRSRR